MKKTKNYKDPWGREFDANYYPELMALAGHDITDAYSFVFSDSRGGLPFLATAYHWDGGFNFDVLMHMIKDFGINPIRMKVVHNYSDESKIFCIKIIASVCTVVERYMCWTALRRTGRIEC